MLRLLGKGKVQQGHENIDYRVMVVVVRSEHGYVGLEATVKLSKNGLSTLEGRIRAPHMVMYAEISGETLKKRLSKLQPEGTPYGHGFWQI